MSISAHEEHEGGALRVRVWQYETGDLIGFIEDADDVWTLRQVANRVDDDEWPAFVQDCIDQGIAWHG